MSEYIAYQQLSIICPILSLLLLNVYFPQNGTLLPDGVADVAMSDDGSVVLTGYSSGVFNVSSSPSSYLADESNFVAIKLDIEGAEVWRWQVKP